MSQHGCKCNILHDNIWRLQSCHPGLHPGCFSPGCQLTIDFLYANVKEAYRVTTLPPLGKSDHNLLCIQPQYTSLVQRQAVSTRSIRRWTPQAEEALRDCYDTTDWDVLLGAHGEDIEEMTHCLTDYINFCADVVAPTKTVRCYPNTYPNNKHRESRLSLTRRRRPSGARTRRR